MKRNYFRWMIALMLILCVLPVAAYAEEVTHTCTYNSVTNNPACGEEYITTHTCTDPNCNNSYTTSGGIRTHSWDAGFVVKPATCGQAGVRGYNCLNGCGLYTEDPIPALKHNWDAGTVITAATCTEAGMKHYTCQNAGCPLGSVDQAYDALGHDWQETEHQAAICGTAGYTKYVCGNDGSHTKTDTHAALKHNWNEGEVTTAATCTEAGMKRYTCQNANCPLGTVDQPYELGHDWKKTEHQDAICGVAGYTKYVCQRDSSHTKTDTHAALRHNWDAGTVTTAATCTTKGMKHYTCQNAGCPLGTVDQPYDALGHKWDEGKVTTAPTCHSAGVKTYTCGNAGCTVKTKTEAIPATGAHRLSIMLSNSEYHYQYCWNEGCKYVTTGYHDWSRWRVARVATEEKDGLLRKDCLWCNQKRWSSYKYSDNPPTSDAVVIPALVMLMSATALPVAVHQRRKRK